MQEALLVMWRLPAPPPDPLGWFVRTTVHRARHLRRTLQRRRHHENATMQRCHRHPECDNPLHHACAHELAARVADAVGRLPTVLRDVFELCEESGLDYAGLAAFLAVPEGTVRSRLHRARQAVHAAVLGSVRARSQRPADPGTPRNHSSISSANADSGSRARSFANARQ